MPDKEDELCVSSWRYVGMNEAERQRSFMSSLPVCCYPEAITGRLEHFKKDRESPNSHDGGEEPNAIVMSE